jgi:hypothetical protein
MGTDGTALSNGVTGALLLLDTYHTLNRQRTDINRHIAALAPDDPAQAILWQELDSLLCSLNIIVSALTRFPATHLPELQAKADVLATLLKPGETGGGPIIPENKRVALALSLTDDVARFSVS